MNRLVVIGSVIADQLMTVPRLPDRGGDVLAGPVATQAGGAFNIAAAAVRLGLPTALCGRVGTGPLGDLLAHALADLGVEALLPRDPSGDSGTCIGLVEPDGERTFVTSPGVEQGLTDDDLASVGWRADDAVYLSGYDLVYPTTGPAVARWLAGFRPGTLLIDPGPLVAEIPAAVLDAALAAATVLSLNERELDLLGEEPGGALTTLWPRLADGAVVVARVGAEGAWLHRRGAEPELVGSIAVDVVDTTGAGDAHAGALLACLADGLTLPAAVRR
ncbi:MAG TPA: PfkB family carbohydrate kinase, partial [Arachnia sp.]|nr:PfkB family carbohydrate kinase [Arachnia sp.]